MNKSKNFIKTFVFAFAFLLTLALTLGITGAWYNTRRQADGVITMSDGIVIEYSGFGQGSGEWQNNSADFLLFATNNEAGPGTTATLNASGIKAGSGSADFFVRAKLEYKFFTDVEGLTEVTSQIADYSAFINTPTFAQGWVDSNNGDGWFYYATGSTFNTLPSADYVNVFTPGQSITLNGAADGFNHQGGGYKYSDEILIKRVTVVLTLEAYQADQTAAANAGWTIVPAYTDAAGVVYTQNANETWTLTDGVSVIGNYTVLSEITQENETNDVVAIAPKAFKNAATLTAVTIPATIASVGEDAFTGTGLTEVTIENGDSVITGIEAAGIPTASTINVPAAVLSGYETTLGASYTNLAAVAGPVILTAVASDNSNYGEYMAIDSDGNKWYFDLGYYNSDNDGFPYNDMTSFPSFFTVDNVFGNKARINKCTMYDKHTFSQTINIPAFIFNGEQNIPVIALSGDSNPGIFMDNATSLTAELEIIGSVIIPGSIKIINNNAFDACHSITSIVISDGVEIIVDQSLAYMGSLNAFNIPSSIKYIGEYVFMNAWGLATITIDSSTIAALNYSDSCLLDNATTVYVLEGLTVGDYIGNWGHTTTSDKAGYVKYVKNS